MTNPNLDRDLKKRWDATCYNRMGQMTTNYDGEGDVGAAIPVTARDGAACLKWTVTGKCVGNCQRKAAHKAYGPALVTKCHTFMDQCQVVGL